MPAILGCLNSTDPETWKRIRKGCLYFKFESLTTSVNFHAMLLIQKSDKKPLACCNPLYYDNTFIMQHVMCTFVIANGLLCRKWEQALMIWLSCLAFHWAQYMCSMILLLFVQFCVSEPTQAWNKMMNGDL